MFDARRNLSGLSLAAVFWISAAGVAHAGDDQKAAADAPKPAPSADHVMMDHSKGDIKGMSMMKDKNVPVHHAGDAPAKAIEPTCKVHMMMDHSKGDLKSMSRMKDPAVPIHHSGSSDKPAAESAPK